MFSNHCLHLQSKNLKVNFSLRRVGSVVYMQVTTPEIFATLTVSSAIFFPKITLPVKGKKIMACVAKS